MSISEDGERMQWVNNGTSMEFQRQSKTIFGRLTPLTFNLMEDQITSDVQLQTLDGGSFSDTKVLVSSMREERLLKYKAMLMQRTETSSSMLKTIMVFINNGTLFTLMNGRANQEKVSSMKSSACMLRDPSILFLK